MESGLWNTMLGKLFFVMYFKPFIAMLFFTLARMSKEDITLRNQFGEKWDDWVKRVPYSVFPGIYWRLFYAYLCFARLNAEIYDNIWQWHATSVLFFHITINTIPKNQRVSIRHCACVGIIIQSTNCKANSNNRWRSSFVALAADIFGRGITLVFRRYFTGNRVWWVGEGKTGGIDSKEYMGRPTFTRNKHPSRLVYRDRVQVTGVPEAQTMGWVGNLKWRTRTSETPCSYARTAPRFQGDGIELDQMFRVVTTFSSTQGRSGIKKIDLGSIFLLRRFWRD